jgi:hypothetical protein
MEKFNCPALTNQNYEYHFSGDCAPFCKCSITGNDCIGKTVDDPEDRSSQFFSRGKVIMDVSRGKRCPLYGASKGIISGLLKEKTERELEQKLENLGK